MARKTLGKPRFYADILQYLKALGYYAGSDSPELWTLDPTNNTEYASGDVNPFTISNPNKSILQTIQNMELVVKVIQHLIQVVEVGCEKVEKLI